MHMKFMNYKKYLYFIAFGLLVVGCFGYLSGDYNNLNKEDRLLKAHYKNVAGSYKIACGEYPEPGVFKELFLDSSLRSQFVCSDFDRRLENFSPEVIEKLKKNIHRVDTKKYQTEDEGKHFKIIFN